MTLVSVVCGRCYSVLVSKEHRNHSGEMIFYVICKTCVPPVMTESRVRQIAAEITASTLLACSKIKIVSEGSDTLKR